MTEPQYSGNASTKRRCLMFHSWLRAARIFLSWSELVMEPVVISSLSMNDRMPVHIVATLQAGFQVPGWKSDMEKHIFLSGWNRPDGVNILIPGGLKGYSDGNIMSPWYSPPWYGESAGPRIMKFHCKIFFSSGAAQTKGGGDFCIAINSLPRRF